MKILAQGAYWILNKDLVREIGIESALLLSDLIDKYYYFLERGELEDGYFFNTSENIEKDTTLTYAKQKKCIKILKEKGYIKTKLKGIPAKLYFTINTDKILENIKSSFKENPKLDLEKIEINNNKYNKNKEINNITINSNTENKVFGENGKENLKNLEEEEKVDKKNILDKPLLKNDSILKKLEEEKKEKKVPLKKEKKEYGNPGVNKIIEIIKENNDGIISGSEKEKRQYAWLLLNKLKKYVNGKYDIFTTLDILLKKMKVSKYYATRITGPKKIYYKFEDMISVVKTEKNSKIRKF